MKIIELVLWKDNKTDGEWKVPMDEVVSGFLASEYAEKVKCEECALEHGLKLYITSNNGLSSVFEPNDFEVFYEKIRPVLREKL